MNQDRMMPGNYYQRITITIWTAFLLCGYSPTYAQMIGRDEVFKAPRIYTLRGYAGQGRRPAGDDAFLPARQDSFSRYRQDSLNDDRRDSLLLSRLDSLIGSRGDSTEGLRVDTALRGELEGIKAEVRQIKYFLKDQQFQGRYQQLKYQEDSIKSRIMHLSSAYRFTKADYLQWRIYELQLDSLHNEWQKIHPGAPSGLQKNEERFRTPDSAFSNWNHAPEPEIDTIYSRRRSDDTIYTAGRKRDTVYSIQRPVDTIYSRRRITDTIYTPVRKRDTVYSLSRPVDTVYSRKRSTDIVYTPSGQRAAISSSGPPADTVYTPVRKRDTVHYTVARSTMSKAPAPDSSIRILQAQLDRNKDSLSYLQAQARQASDSAGYFKALALQQQTYQQAADSAAARKKWYQRIIPRRKKESTPLYNEENEERERQYNDRSALLQSQLDDLQQRNAQLERNYEQVLADRNDRRDRGTRLDVSAPPVMVYPPSPENDRYDRRTDDDIRSMRAELETLRREVNRSHTDIPPVVIAPSGQPGPLQNDRPAAAGPGDSAQLDSIRMEITRLRHKLDKIPDTRSFPEKPASAHVASDTRNYPVISVYFKVNAATLEEDEIGKLAPLAAAAAQNKDKNILLKASTDPVGNTAANRAIASKRTEFVRSILTSRFGIAPGRLISLDPVIRSKGRSKKPNPFDRKVDVKFQ